LQTNEAQSKTLNYTALVTSVTECRGHESVLNTNKNQS